MISKNQQKLITSLHQKKYRDKNGLFLIEGDKMVCDLVSRREINQENVLMIAVTENWLSKNSLIIESLSSKLSIVDDQEMQKLSTHVTAPGIIAVCRIRQNNFHINDLKEDYTLVFDAIRDPGNMGTIIRTADWFGIKKIICSKDSVDMYNNKVVQASMGAIIRMNVYYTDLDEVLEQAGRMKIPVYGTTMDGEDFYDTPIKNPGLIVFGNESSGISDQIMPFLKHKIRIPDSPPGQSGTESLNIASTVAVVCAELRRRIR